MNIEHAALYTNDLEAMKDFFIKYFGASANGLYHNQKTGFQSYFLSFEPKPEGWRSAGAHRAIASGKTQGGARLEIMTRPGLIPGAAGQRLGYGHIAFSLGSKEAVDELTARLKDDGYTVLSGPRTTGDGYYESAVAGPEGLEIEITV